MHRFIVYVTTASHDDVKAGDTCTGVSRIEVLADTPSEARLVACQIAAIRGMPTGCEIDWEADLADLAALTTV